MSITFQPPPGVTRDSILNGRLIIYQPERGYRFSLDAVLLADFAKIPSGKTVLDLGAGSGVISLVLTYLMEEGRIIAVELQKRLADCARLNVKTNALENRIQVLEKDWINLSHGDLNGPVEYIVTNPPYRRLGTGRVNPDGEEALARHELRGSLTNAARTASRLLDSSGSLAVIYPADRLVHLMTELVGAGLMPKRLRLVHSRVGENARLVLVEARRGGGEELMVLPPLYVYEQGSRYTSEVRSILFGDPSDV